MAWDKSKPKRAVLLSNGSEDLKEMLLWACFYSKNILSCRNDERDESLMKLQWKAPHITMIQQNNYFPPRDRSCSILSVIGSTVTSSTLFFPSTHSEIQEITYSVEIIITIIIMLLTYLTYSFHWCHQGIAMRNQLCPGWRPYLLSLSNQPLHRENTNL